MKSALNCDRLSPRLGEWVLFVSPESFETASKFGYRGGFHNSLRAFFSDFDDALTWRNVA